jgi:hypothetical protein
MSEVVPIERVAPGVTRLLTDSRCCSPNGDDPMVRGRVL